MANNDGENQRPRRDPRYVEKSSDLSDWIQVKLVEQFGKQNETSGLLLDLTPRAVKVAFPALRASADNISEPEPGPGRAEPTPPEPSMPTFLVGSRLLITFRFKDLMSTTATATVARIDKLENGIGVVFFFDFIRDTDRDEIARICIAYHHDQQETSEIPQTGSSGSGASDYPAEGSE